MNNLKTLVLFSALTGVLVVIGGSIAGPQGAIFAFGFAIITNFFSYWNSAKIILRISGYPKMTFFRTFIWKKASKKIYKVTFPTVDLLNQFILGGLSELDLQQKKK